VPNFSSIVVDFFFFFFRKIKKKEREAIAQPPMTEKRGDLATVLTCQSYQLGGHLNQVSWPHDYLCPNQR